MFYLFLLPNGTYFLDVPSYIREREARQGPENVFTVEDQQTLDNNTCDASVEGSHTKTGNSTSPPPAFSDVGYWLRTSCHAIKTCVSTKTPPPWDLPDTPKSWRSIVGRRKKNKQPAARRPVVLFTITTVFLRGQSRGTRGTDAAEAAVSLNDKSRDKHLFTRPVARGVSPPLISPKTAN